MRIGAVLITCTGREAMCRSTVEGLEATDWPATWPILVSRDEAEEGSKQHRQQMNARNALYTALDLRTDFILFLEDDVMFNAHMCHNLSHWRPVRDRLVGMASLYNPTIHERERSPSEHWFRADAGAVYGSQAYLFSFDAASYIADHWHEVEGMQDIKMSRLAERGGWPIYYYTPSLVQHVGRDSTWGGGFHYARDFDPGFRLNGAVAHVPFNGDRFIGHEIRKLVARFGIRSIVETGMWSAHTTREFRTMVRGRVTTIDVTDEHLVEEFGAGALQELTDRDISVVFGNSNERLAEVLAAHGPADHPLLAYLDAQGVGNPLMEELDALGADPLCRDRCVIAIHDVQAPGKPWGCNWVDWGAGAQPLSYEVIASKLPAIYPAGHAFHFNDVAEGCQRGIVYIYPRS